MFLESITLSNADPKRQISHVLSYMDPKLHICIYVHMKDECGCETTERIKEVRKGRKGNRTYLNGNGKEVMRMVCAEGPSRTLGLGRKGVGESTKTNSTMKSNIVYAL